MNANEITLESEIMRAVWPSMVGAALSCAHCKNVLDCSRAGRVEIKIAGRIQFDRIMCSRCFDALVDKIGTLADEQIAITLSGAPSDESTSVDIDLTDGRVVMGGGR